MTSITYILLLFSTYVIALSNAERQCSGCSQNQILCPNEDNSPGGKCQPTYTAKRQRSNKYFCRNFCKISCGTSMVSCPEIYTDQEGCETHQYCVSDVSECYKPEYDENGCPNHAAEEQMTCEGTTSVKCPVVRDHNGCPMPRTCSDSIANCEVSEYNERGCRVVPENLEACPEGHKRCDKKHYDDRGCMEEPMCIPVDSTCPASRYDNNGCPSSGEGGSEITPCGEGSVTCPRVINPANGCLSPTTCAPCLEECEGYTPPNPTTPNPLL